MGTVLLALGLVLVVEGLIYAVAPSMVEAMLVALRQMSLEQRRLLGLATLCSGVVLIWLSRGLGIWPG
jgi:uncharacterized protein YjeT (DUF2065 family)